MECRYRDDASCVPAGISDLSVSAAAIAGQHQDVRYKTMMEKQYRMFDRIYEIDPGIQSRWASSENPNGTKAAGGAARSGRKGAAWFTLEDGASAVLAHAENTSGMIRRIWITMNERTPRTLRGVILEMYWDGASKPAVSAPIGDFFCHGIGRMAIFENALFSSGEGRNFNCCIPMPFRSGMKILVKNNSGQQIKHFYYDVNYTLGDEFRDNTLYFHSFFHRENPTTLGKDFELLPYLNGRGRYLGVNIGIRCDMEKYFQTWWGEGEVKIYLDGDGEYPTICGTGVEDYVSTAWGQGYFCNQYHGSQIYDTENMEIACYRLHIPDPIYFHENIRVTVQQIGGIDTNDELNKARLHFNTIQKGLQYRSVDGHSIDFSAVDGSIVMPELFERQDDWSCCTYFYYHKASSSLPILSPEAGML
jgi:hypothetical protein